MAAIEVEVRNTSSVLMPPEGVAWSDPFEVRARDVSVLRAFRSFLRIPQ